MRAVPTDPLPHLWCMADDLEKGSQSLHTDQGSSDRQLLGGQRPRNRRSRKPSIPIRAVPTLPPIDLLTAKTARELGLDLSMSTGKSKSLSTDQGSSDKENVPATRSQLYTSQSPPPIRTPPTLMPDIYAALDVV